jgi:hypothetical protein
MRGALQRESRNIHAGEAEKYLNGSSLSLLILSFGPLSSLSSHLTGDRAMEAAAPDGPPQQDPHGTGHSWPAYAPVDRLRA